MSSSAGIAGSSDGDSSEIGELGQKIITLASEKNGGITNDDLVQNFSTYSVEERVGSINKLLQLGIIEVLTKGTSLIYRLKDSNKKTTLPKGADNEEKIVYSIIEEGGNKGIWIRDIRVKSNLIMTQLNKILKNLENKKLIKHVKSVNVRKFLIYKFQNKRIQTF